MPKFEPTAPFSIYHEGDEQNKDSVFLSGIINEQITIGGVAIYVWLLNGTFDQRERKGDIGTQLDEEAPNLDIQDKIFMENRDRKYSDNAARLMGTYTVSQNELDFARFGVMLTSDIIQMEFHKEEMERICGRRLMVGDVIEMPHLRDVGFDGRPMNRYYEVQSLTRAPSGWDPAYVWHILVATMKPMKDAQEFIDIMERDTVDGSTVQERISQRNALEELTAENQDAAFEQAYTTWWDNTPIYIDPELDTVYRWTDDGVPPNGIEAKKLTNFPGNPSEGDYVLRVDMFPNRLYRFQNNRWMIKEIDRKREWNTYNWVVKLRQHMTDRTEEDDLRPWEYKSIHDVLTPRHDRSDASPKAKKGESNITVLGTWKPWFASPSFKGGVSSSDILITPIELTLIPTASPLDVHSSLNEDSGAFENVLIQYVAIRDDDHEFGELMISDTGTETDFRHEYTEIGDNIGLNFEVIHIGSSRKLRYTASPGSDITFRFRIVERW